MIRAGSARAVIAGGMDSMSTIPYLLKNVRFQGFKMGDRTLEDGWSDSIDPTCGYGMGGTAEYLAEKHGIQLTVKIGAVKYAHIAAFWYAVKILGYAARGRIIAAPAQPGERACSSSGTQQFQEFPAINSRHVSNLSCMAVTRSVLICYRIISQIGQKC